MPQYHKILSTYLDQYALPAMLAQGWATKLAKGPDYAAAQRAGYHIEQALRTHIVNGLFAITRIVEYLAERNYYHLGETDFKRLLVLYTLHDAYKDPALKQHQMGKSDFGIPLDRLNALVEAMELRRFLPDLTAGEVRVASVSSLSENIGDLSDCPPATSRLLTAVHLADSLASQQTARDHATTGRYLHKLLATTATACFARQAARQAARAGQSFTAPDLPPPPAFYYHELDEYRGLSTLLIHQATAEVLAAHQLYPILYFANGILYLGPSAPEADPTTLRADIGKRVFALIKQQVGDKSPSIARQALKYGQGLKFSKYVYLFSGVDDLLKAVADRPQPKDPRNFVANVIAKRVDKKKYANAQEFYSRFGIPSSADNDRALAERWNAVYSLLMGAENVAKALVPGDTLDWLLTTYAIPEPIAGTVRQHRQLLNAGGVPDHCLIIAYHWLTGYRFGAERRDALQVDTAAVQQAVADQAGRALAPYDKLDRRLAFVDEELGLERDLGAYLESNLVFSFAAQRLAGESPLALYQKARGYAHKRLCVICNRPIPREVKDANIITDIAEQQAQVFSNRLLPAAEVSGQMVWCPLCYLEFMLRKISGQGFPSDSDPNISRRVYLYVLPDYSFTPAFWQRTGRELLGEFYGEQTAVTRLPLRGSKEHPSLPRQWLETGQVSAEWLDLVREMFVDQARRMNAPDKAGRTSRQKSGDHLRISFGAPNYLLMSYDNAAADQKLAPTRSEIWAKALYTAALIHLLVGARVYVTEKPYLSITRPEEMRRVIEMEGLPSLLYGLLPVCLAGAAQDRERATESSATLPLPALPDTLDLLAAIWQITAELFRGDTGGDQRNLDKNVAAILGTLAGNPLAGATLYKDLARGNEAPYNPQAFIRACTLLLPRGESDRPYRLMLDQEGGDIMNLAEHITELSLDLFLPYRTPIRGRAHRYERVFRTGIEAIKSNALLSKDELLQRVAGHILKRLPAMKGGARPTYGAEQADRVQQLAQVLVQDLFRDRCDSSVSKLTHEENWLADTIYFLTAQQISDRWIAYGQRHPKAGEGDESDEGDQDDEGDEEDGR